MEKLKSNKASLVAQHKNKKWMKTNNNQTYKVSRDSL